MPNPFPTTVTLTASAITLHVGTRDAGKLRDAVFFPADRDVIDDDAPQATTAGPEGPTLTLPRDGLIANLDRVASVEASPGTPNSEKGDWPDYPLAG